MRRYADRRDSATFCALSDELACRSQQRGHTAIVLVDNARFHRSDQSKLVGRAGATINRRLVALRMWFEFLADRAHDKGHVGLLNPVVPRRHIAKR